MLFKSILICFLASASSVQTENRGIGESDQHLLKDAKTLVHEQKYDEAVLIYKKSLLLNPNNVDSLLQLGILQVRLGNNKEAIEIYKKALEIEPDNEQVQVALAFAYLFQNDLDKSAELLEKALKRSPDNSEVLAGLGYIAMLNGNELKAEQFLDRALKANPKNITARIYMGNLRIRQQRLDEAGEIFERLDAENPDNPDVKLGLFNLKQEKEKTESDPSPLPVAKDSQNEEQLINEADRLRSEKKYKEAALLYEKLVLIDPQNVDYALALGRLHVSLDRIDEAVLIYENALTLQPKRLDIQTAMAFAYLFGDRLESSQNHFQAVLREDPNNADALAGLGKIAERRDRPSEAESYLQKALQLDEKNSTALIYLAQLKMRQKDYQAAYAIYQKVAQINPADQDVAQRVLDVQELILANEAKQLLTDKKYKDAENIYRRLIERSPKKADYFGEISRIRKLQGDKAGAIQALNQALELEPDRQDIRTQLAFAYLFEKNLALSKELFEIVLEKEKSNPEALAGFGRILALEGRTQEAEHFYKKALEGGPNPTALEFLAILKYQQKKYSEALSIYSKLITIDPQNTDYLEGYKQAQEQPIVEEARALRKNKDNAGAAVLVEQLIKSSPKKIEYYLMLGSIYVSMERKEDAIDLYNQGLIIKPNDKDLLNGLGFIYLNKALRDHGEGAFGWGCHFPFLYLKEKANLRYSKELFQSVVELDPKNPNALAGLGRIALLEGSDQEAERLYFEALNSEPENTTALAYLASLQSLQRKNFTAANTYNYLMRIEPSEDLRSTYTDFLRANAPSIDLTAYYAEENEKNQITELWEARLKNYGAAATIIYPLVDRLKVIANFAADYIVLKNLITGPSIYSIDIQRPRLGFVWTHSPYLSVSGGANLAFFSQYHNSTSYTKSGFYFLPFFNTTYSKNFHTVSFETIGDAPIVARDFIKNSSTLIARQFVNAVYEYDFTKRRLIGTLASYAWYYNSIQNNEYQTASAWIQLTPPRYWENISVRYQYNYDRFNILTANYYTFRPRMSHWLKLDLTKNWLNDQLITEAGFWHCWQRSFENGQIVAVTPESVFRWVNREIDSAYGRVKFIMNDWLEATVLGTYSIDNFDYTTASISARINVKF